MGWRIIKQPNGFYARFSEIVDEFTDWNMTEQEAFELCSDLAGVKIAETKMYNANNNIDPYTMGSNFDRFEHAIDVIRCVHGSALAKERKDELSRMPSGAN